MDSFIKKKPTEKLKHEKNTEKMGELFNYTAL